MNILQKQIQRGITQNQRPRSSGAGTTVAALSMRLTSIIVQPCRLAYGLRSRHTLMPAGMQVLEQRMEQLPRTTTTAPSSEEWYMEVPFMDLRMESLARNTG